MYQPPTVDRRTLLQMGYSSFFGLSLPGVMNAQVDHGISTSPRAQSVVLVFLTGGGSHIDMFDPKPEVSEVKGEFSPIDTQLPGVQFTEMMPGLSQRANQLAVVRSMAHRDNRHLSASHNALTGSIQAFRGNSNQDKSLNRADWPSYGSALGYFRPMANGLPSQFTVPNPLIEGNLVWPGQHAGFLGPRCDPFQVKEDPNKKDFKVNGLKLLEGLSIERLDDRLELLQTLNDHRHALDASARGQQFSNQQQSAYSMLTSAKLARAFHLHKETDKDRERYGRNTLGQTLLLARRLVEIEVPVVQCNMGRVQTWDTHVNHFPRVKKLIPQVDQGVSALLDDLAERGLLETTLVIIVGEFGRTPTISPLPGAKVPGRHHWAWGYTAVFAGGGVRGGQVIGKTDRIGGRPVTRPFHPNDMGATIYQSLGIEPSTEILDRLKRPRRLCQGKVMDVLYDGKSVS